MHRLFHILLGAGIAAILAIGGARSSTTHYPDSHLITATGSATRMPAIARRDAGRRPEKLTLNAETERDQERRKTFRTQAA
jgi:hypothetical protein